MKTYLLLTLVMINGSSGLFAQNHLEQAFILDSLPRNGIILDKGWKFHAGDNPAWAQPDMDDSHWQPIHPAQSIRSLTEIRQAQIGWLRLHIKPAGRLQGQILAAGIEQAGASEIYLNGKLVYRAGRVSADFSQERTFNPSGRPFSIQFSDAPDQVLAVRYSFNKGNLYSGYLVGFKIVLATVERRWVLYTFGIIISIDMAFVVGVFLILGILHLLLYITYPARRANLFFSAYTCCMVLVFLSQALSLMMHSASSFFFTNLLLPLTFNLAVVFYLQAIYALFNQRRGIVFKVLVSYFLLAIVVSFIQGWRVLQFTHYITTIIAYSALIHVGWIAVREKQRGARTFFLGQVITLLLYFLLVIVNELFYQNVYSAFYTALELVVLDIAFLCPPVIISLLLAREFAQTNFSLKQQLDEVKRLSEKAIVQEQEKQQLLADQKIEKIRFENELQVQKLENEKTKAELKQQATELEMQALRAQMNPHFIFNSLNSIDLFILQNDKAQASKYLTKFSRLIRMILNSSANASVNLADDLQALQLYLELEELRCEQKFSFEIKCDPDIDTDFIQVPPMLLQPFVENAIWHGLMNKEGEGHLCINIKHENSVLICVITDDGIGREKAAELEDKSGKHKSMGMKITESRIAMMEEMTSADKSVKVRDLIDADGNAAGTEVVMMIPIMEQA